MLGIRLLAGRKMRRLRNSDPTSLLSVLIELRDGATVAWADMAFIDAITMPFRL